MSLQYFEVFCGNSLVTWHSLQGLGKEVAVVFLGLCCDRLAVLCWRCDGCWQPDRFLMVQGAMIPKKCDQCRQHLHLRQSDPICLSWFFTGFGSIRSVSVISIHFCHFLQAAVDLALMCWRRRGDLVTERQTRGELAVR